MAFAADVARLRGTPFPVLVGLARLLEPCLLPAQQTGQDPRPFGFCLVSGYLGLNRLLPVVLLCLRRVPQLRGDIPRCVRHGTLALQGPRLQVTPRHAAHDLSLIPDLESHDDLAPHGLQLRPVTVGLQRHRLVLPVNPGCLAVGSCLTGSGRVLGPQDRRLLGRWRHPEIAHEPRLRGLHQPLA